MLNKYSPYEKWFLAMCIALPFATYNIDFGLVSISIDRIIFLVLMVAFPIYFINNRQGSVKIFILTVYLVFTVVFSIVFGSGFSQASLKFIPSQVQSYVLFLISASVFINNPKSTRLLKTIFYAWSFTFLLYSIYTYYYYIIIGTTNVPFPFREFANEDDLHKHMMLRSYRLFMPTASAPFLGAVSGFFAIYGITDFLSNNNKKTLFTSIAMLAVCILTLSRGPLLSFLISITVYHLLVSMYVKNNLNKASLIVPFVFLLVFISISIYSSFQLSEFGRDTASRLIFTAQDILESRHLSLRARALELFIDGSFSQKIFGRGLGSIGEDGLGAYSFSSYLTILVETGLLGAVGVLVVMLSPIKKLYKKTKFHIAYRTMFIQYFSMAVFLLLVNSFYELKTLQLLWVLMSFIYAMGESMPYNIKQLEPLKYSK